MLTVTEGAAAHLAKVLETSDVPDDGTLRIVKEGQSLGITADKPRDEDQTVEHNGKTVLVLDEQVAQMLSGRTLDIDEQSGQPQLAIR